MYYCHVGQVIWKDDTREEHYAFIYREVELPFPPFIDMELLDERWISGVINRVQWSIKENKFFVQVQDSVFYSDNDYSPQVYLEDALSAGWLQHHAENNKNA